MPCFLLCLLLCSTPDSTHLTNSLDSLIAPQFQGNVPGMAVLVASHGHVMYKKAFGSANIELGIPLSPDMVFKIGSISKQFTAAGILHLTEQGKIHLTDTIQQYLKNYPRKGEKITIENLLTHTSGIVDYMALDDPDPYITRKEFSPQEIIRYFQDSALQFAPGSNYAYSNSNYTLLAYIVQIVTGMPFHTYMTDSILPLAGLQHTEYADAMTFVPGRVEGYTRDLGFYQNAEYLSMSLAYGAGDLLSTPEDLYRWNCALLDGKVLSPKSLQRAWTPFHLANGQSTHYGYAWFVDSLLGVPCIHHEGQINGFIAEEKYFPDQDLYVCTITNVLSGEDKTTFSEGRYRLMANIAEVALGKGRPQAVALSEKTLDLYVGDYGPVDHPKKALSIYKEHGQLFCDLSNHTGRHMLLVPESSTLFYLPDVLRIRTTIEFKLNDGKVTGLICTQEKPYRFVRVN